MTSLHLRLLAEIDGFDKILVHKVRFNVALRAVVELHAPVRRSIGRDLPTVDCQGCDQDLDDSAAPAWPCSTIQAIARELGVDGGE